MRILKRVLVCCLGWILCGCSSLLYYPSRGLYVNPSKLTPPPEEHQFLLEDLQIHGWIFRARTQPAKAMVLFFHGNAQNRSAHFLSLFWLVEAGYDLAIFDYPGYGQTGGQPSPKSTVQMARAAMKYVQQQNKSNRWIVYGHSLGGAIAMRAVWEERESLRPNLLVVDSSFLSYRTAARRLVAKSPWTWVLQPVAWLLMNDTWAPGQRIGDLNGIPLVVTHPRNDEIIPFDLGEDIFSTASEPKQFWPKENMSHNNLFSGPDGEVLKQKLLLEFSRL